MSVIESHITGQKIYSFARNKDDEASLQYSLLYRSYYPSLCEYAGRITGSQHAAEDIVQDVFTKLWSMREELSVIRDMKSFLFRMTQNLSISLLRRIAHERKSRNCIYTRERETRSITLDMLDGEECSRRLQAALQRLSPQRKKIFVLRRVEGWKRKEIASILGLSESTVRQTLNEAIRQMEAYMNNEE